MISPEELKNKTFSRSVRGYNAEEVDEYIDFLLEKYTEAYKENSEITAKLNSVKAKYDELSDDEESIRTVILKAQKLAEKIVDNAKKEADAIVDTVVARCDDVVAEAKKELAEEKESLTSLRVKTENFKQKLFDDYTAHLKQIKEMKFGDSDSVDADCPTDADIDGATDRIKNSAEERIHSAVEKTIENA